MDNKPQGSKPPGLGSPQQDRRITDLLLEQLTTSLLGKPTKFAADSLRSLTNFINSPTKQNPMVIGLVVHSVPNLNWYRVQLGEGGGQIGCALLRDDATVSPIGPRDGHVIQPNTPVLVQKMHYMPYGWIIGVLPPIIQDNSIFLSDYLVQGGQSGIKREDAHQQPLTGTVNAGGIQDFSCQSPLDATSLEWSKITETGIAILLDSFQFYARVSEICGLYLNYFDEYTRLTGRNLDIWSFFHEDSHRYDEGECNRIRRTAIYPWEATGQLSRGLGVGEVKNEDDVQFKLPLGSVDLKGSERQLQPAFRSQQFDGYLGQGSYRSIVLPQADNGSTNLATDTKNDIGLFRETIGLDGSILVETAKSFSVIKKVNIAVPKTLKRPESADGDDGREGNYAFSGTFGSPVHQIRDVKSDGLGRSMASAVGAMEFALFHANWKAVHPFHYHKKDYRLPEEKDAANDSFTRTQDFLSFDVLSSQGYMSDPTPQKLKIDHRYGDVDYYRRISFFSMMDDGSIALGCGYGAQLVFNRGTVRIDAPANFEVVCGGEAVLFGRDVILRAHNSCDISASNNDVRIAAFNNLQITANHMLFDSKGATTQYEYDNRIGDEVQGGGIVFKSAGDVVLLGNNIYQRTIIDGGNIFLDTARQGVVSFSASTVTAVTENGVALWHGTREQKIEQTHQFLPTGSILSGNMVVDGNAILSGDKAGNLVINGSLAVKENIVTAGDVASKRGGMMSKAPDEIKDRINDQVREGQQAFTTAVDEGNDFENRIDERWRSAGQPGNELLIQQFAFSFRDDNAGVQYRSQNFQFIEPRWIQQVRLGAASGGKAWNEMVIDYQGNKQSPWPGFRTWFNAFAFVELATEGTMFNYPNGVAQDRGSIYESPEINAALSKLADGMKVIN